MSKITLEPNDSGAGTFSIVSPDSNTNRTLNLPDEAGKLLSTGNNDPAEVFKQSNILGTVSESGGVPTGAIIETGSNSNGFYQKFADGTMIVWSGRGGIRGEETWNFPATFIDIPTGLSMNHGAPFSASVNDTTTSSLLPLGHSFSGNAFAIGRWY